MKLAAIMLCVLLLLTGVKAEETAGDLLGRVDLDALATLSGDLGGPDVRELARRIISGDYELSAETPRRIFKRLLYAIREALAEGLKSLAPSLLAALAMKLALFGHGSDALKLLCRAGCACAMAHGFSKALDVARSAMALAERVSSTVAPALAAVLAMSGSHASAAALSPLSSLCSEVIERLLSDIGVPLCCLAAVVTCAGNLSDRFRLEHLPALIRQTASWGVGVLMSAFVGLMTLEGKLSAARDTVSARAVQQTVRSVVPVIGSQVSDSAGAIAASAALLRNSIGVTGVLMLAFACFKPLLRLTAYMLSAKLAAAVVEPLGEPGITRVVSGFSDAAQTLLAVAAGGMTLAVLLIGAGAGILPS